MHAVVFEFRPHPDQRDAYFALVAELRPELLAMPGFLENERFQSRRDPGRLVSFQLWRDEAAILRWRDHPRHQVARERGRSAIFAAYRLRVGEVTLAPDEPAGLRLAFGHGLPVPDGAERQRPLVEQDLEDGELAQAEPALGEVGPQAGLQRAVRASDRDHQLERRLLIAAHRSWGALTLARHWLEF